MIDQPQYLTPEGLEKLDTRFRYLVDVARPQVAERLRIAREEGGDLNENADYLDAKEAQAFVEAEISRLEYILRQSKLLPSSPENRSVMLGSVVTIAEQGSDAEETYQLVSSAEANPSHGKISAESPLGHSLLGAEVGSKVKVSAPDGELIFTVKAVC